MFVPHVTVPHRARGGGKPTRRQNVGAVVAAVVAAIVSAIVGGTLTRGSRDETVAIAGLVVGAAFVVGIVVARKIGGQSRL